MREETWEMVTGLQHLGALRQFVSDCLAGFGVKGGMADDVIQAVDECATNIIQHGYRGRPGKLTVRIGFEKEAVRILVKDQAPPFDPTQVPAPDITVPLEERQPGGLGIYLTRHFVDDMVYRLPPEGGNELYLIKNVSGGNR